ncbi:hypothetical protein [Streptomyces sp. NPDC001292]|uniref:hypothetical protein n=1 Tax=Streptomyces sp. NPDC001292 TaxID=3364558 RepID=UPI0036C596B1
MSKRMLRSVLVAAFSSVVAFGALSGLSGAKGDVRAEVARSSALSTTTSAEGDGAGEVLVPNDTSWG